VSKQGVLQSDEGQARSLPRHHGLFRFRVNNRLNLPTDLHGVIVAARRRCAVANPAFVQFPTIRLLAASETEWSWTGINTGEALLRRGR